MPTYAIIETGGKQYRVEKGQSLLVDRLPEDEGAEVALRPLMLRTDDDVVIVPKELEKVKVEAKVAGHERGEKIRVFKYKPKKGYRRTRGHRSELTRLEVTELKLAGKRAAKKEEVAKGGAKAAQKRREAEKADAKRSEAAAGAADAGDLPATIGKPATRTLHDAGLTTLDQIAGKTEEELLALRGIGPKAVGSIAEALEGRGLALKKAGETEGEEKD